MSESSQSAFDPTTSVFASYDTIEVGQRLPELEIEITRKQLIKFAGAVDDYAAPHWDETYMTQQGFPGVIVHGWLTFSVMCQAATKWIPIEIADYRALKVRYLRPNRPGRVVYGGSVVGKSIDDHSKTVKLAIWAADLNGKRLAEGFITAVFAS